MTKDSKLEFYFLYTLICLIWGSTWLVIHIGANAALPPFTGAALRFLLATVLIWLFAIFRKIPLPADRKAWGAVIIVGILSNGISFGIVYGTSPYVPSGLGAVIFGTMPLWTAIGSHWALQSEKLTAVKILGILLGIIGIATIFYPQIEKVDSTHLWAMGVLLIAPIVSAASAIVTKRSTQSVAPIMLNAITTSVGCLILGITALMREPWQDISLNFAQVWTISYLAILGTIVTFGIYFRLIKETSAVTMTYVAIVTPVIAVFLGWLILNERLDYYALGGSALVVVGVGVSLRM
ncbi:MAG: EamA family transporter [Bacteroidota bacterium]|nr:EamA family transporter [Bacteroidota bacterium]MDP4229478.1 EamA family transporter [Bacteroidota bacterium]MDP4236391.1 EamA family transporter [Bacteroidota bacterium]